MQFHPTQFLKLEACVVCKQKLIQTIRNVFGSSLFLKLIWSFKQKFISVYKLLWDGQTLHCHCMYLSPPDDDALQISRPFYTHSVISNYYTIRREELTRLAKWVVLKATQFYVYYKSWGAANQYFHFLIIFVSIICSLFFHVLSWSKAETLLLSSQGQVVCRLPDDWRFGQPVWWTLD